MKNILIPVDFSISCYNAFRYGSKLAETTGRNIVLAHYYVDSFYHPGNVPTEDDIRFREAYIRRLKLFILPANHLRDFDYEDNPKSVEISFECKPVISPSDAILARALSSDVDLVVMGTRTSQLEIQNWYGSTSIRVSSFCERPVFLIPPSVKFEEFDKIVVANSKEVSEPFALWQIEGITDLYGASVHFLHVEKPDTASALRFVPWGLMRELVDKEPRPPYKFTVASVEDEDITEGILDYAKEINAKLLIIINKSEDKMGKLVHESLTQDIAMRAALPIVILHTEIAYNGLEK